MENSKLVIKIIKNNSKGITIHKNNNTKYFLFFILLSPFQIIILLSINSHLTKFTTLLVIVDIKLCAAGLVIIKILINTYLYCFKIKQ